MGEEAEVKKLFYSYENLVNDCQSIARDMSVAGYKPDVIIGPGRGGYLIGVMFSHYFDVPFRGFNWQTRDGEFEDVKTLKHILEKYIDHKVLLVDDINDTGTTLQSIENIIYDDALESGNDPDLKVATLLSKSQSESQNVDFYARELTPDNDPWIVFPYEQWWNFNNEE